MSDTGDTGQRHQREIRADADDCPNRARFIDELLSKRAHLAALAELQAGGGAAAHRALKTGARAGGAAVTRKGIGYPASQKRKKS